MKLPYDEHSYPLYANRWAGGSMDAEGLSHIERFQLEEPFLSGHLPVLMLC